MVVGVVASIQSVQKRACVEDLGACTLDQKRNCNINYCKQAN